MKRLLLSAAILLCPFSLFAETSQEIIADIVEGHIVPGFSALEVSARRMNDAAQNECAPTSKELRHSYGVLMDAWISVSHLRFGPTEVEDRAFALAFWPDSRGATPRRLNALITAKDPVAKSAKDYATVSIAARGLYAMEFLLFDPVLRAGSDPDYLCRLIRTVTEDIVINTAAIRTQWQTEYAQRLLSPTAAGTYRTEEEVLQEVFKALSTGLQFTSETRLGRPLGTFDQPRPKRAESWRSGRSKRHVVGSLRAQRDLALRLSVNDDELSDRLDQLFETAQKHLNSLNDPIFAGVKAPQSRLRIEVIQQSVNAIRAVMRDELGPQLGVAAGFNALDGD